MHHVLHITLVVSKGKKPQRNEYAHHLYTHTHTATDTRGPQAFLFDFIQICVKKKWEKKTKLKMTTGSVYFL